jgi:membrane-bound metal-dependent hydrolase YbcI (DUF457 family)
MDNVTHTLFALTLARTPLGRGRGTTAALVLSSSAPDVDIVAAIDSATSYLEWHRGPTHGPLGVVALGLSTAAMVWLIGRGIDRERIASFSALLLASSVGVVAHVLMDLPTSYGTRILSPFSWGWYALDLLPIIDVYLLAILTGGLLLRGKTGRTWQIPAAIVFVLMAANYGVRVIAHQEALARTERLFGPTLPRACEPGRVAEPLLASWPEAAPQPVAAASETGFGTTRGGRSCRLDTAAIPTFLSPFRWRVVAQLTDAYEVYDIDVLSAPLRSRTPPPALLTAISRRIPNEWSPPAVQAAAARPAQVLLGFSRFPRVEILDESREETTVHFTDMRFDAGPGDASPMQARRSSLFTAVVRVPRP